MGCGSSRASDIELLDVAPRPNRPGQATADVALSRTDLNRALQYTAQFIAGQRQQIDLIVVGGAVNTMLLGTRSATQDVDFFNSNLSKNEGRLLAEASAYARKSVLRECQTELPKDWLNNRTFHFIPPDQRRALTREAFDQHERVFDRAGLKLLAAPWPYAIVAKLDRIAGGNPHPYDISDASGYLYRYLGNRRLSAIPASTIRQWVRIYHLKVRDTEIRLLARDYEQRYRRRVVDFRR
ncbi:MAG: hypothetical protein M1837_006744 [Sclerophora amabilis]|nr:MAG: hypothetical protein M1837_006744 [Sclerophora amabilis]